jgi:hypothetical protein
MPNCSFPFRIVCFSFYVFLEVFWGFFVLCILFELKFHEVCWVIVARTLASISHMIPFQNCLELTWIWIFPKIPPI